MGEWLRENLLGLAGIIGSCAVVYAALRADLAAMHVRVEQLRADVDYNRDRLDNMPLRRADDRPHS